MFNKELNNQEPNDEQLDNLTNPLADGELSDEELDNVDGGFGFFWNPYPNPWTQPIIGTTIGQQKMFDDSFDNWIGWFSS